MVIYNYFNPSNYMRNVPISSDKIGRKNLINMHPVQIIYEVITFIEKIAHLCFAIILPFAMISICKSLKRMSDLPKDNK